MEQTEQKDLFDINISESSKIYIRKFAGIARIIILFSILISAIMLVQVLIRAVKINPAIYGRERLLLLEHRMMPYFALISFTIICISLYFFWQLSRHLVKGVNDDDSVVFNRSFEILYRYSIYGLISCAFSLIFHLFDFYITIQRHVY